LAPVLVLALVAPGACGGFAAAKARASEAMPRGFVYLRDVAPSIAQDMRYATDRNFTGKPVPGYNAPECVLQRAAAEALGTAQQKARSLGLSLKVYDCYRPVRAVRAFMAWAAGPEDGRTKRYYPHLAKSQLVPFYIASQSGHSTGLSVDLTLIPSGQAADDGSQAAGGDCTAGASERDAGDSLDMGSSFDCFDPKANTAASSVTLEQNNNRLRLKRIMEGAGFENYAGEWWHFTYSRANLGRQYDFPIEKP
jgi:D-alanyl-D-alanine dipeptidase